MADSNKKKYIKYEDTTYILEDSRLPDPTGFDNKVLGVDNGAYVLKQEEGGGGGEGTVKSVNNIEPDENGDVALGASDVHALPDSTVIPTVPRMATNANTTDWTSGKTVDAAVLKTTVMAAERRVSALEDGVSELGRDKADISDIPTAVSDLTNDSGFQTAAQVQTAISTATGTLQTKAITDTGGYYTTDTVEGALQEIGGKLLPSGGSTGDFLRKTASGVAWQTVPSAESNSFGGGST